MRANIGTTDRLIRLCIGSLLLLWALLTRSPLSALIALFTLYEALSSWCILYAILGKNTCPLPSAKRTGFPIIRVFILGWSVFLAALFLNLLARLMGWISWYAFLEQWTMPLSLDNYVYLFLLYPFVLALPLWFSRRWIQ